MRNSPARYFKSASTEGHLPRRHLETSTGGCAAAFLRRLASILAPSVLFFAVTVFPAWGDDPHNCLFCHQFRGLSYYDKEADQLHVFFVQPEYTYEKLGPHARLSCTDCHSEHEVSIVPHQQVSKVDCTRVCHLSEPDGSEQRFSHASVAKMLDKSAHPLKVLAETRVSEGRLLAENQSPCLYCHDEPVFREPTDAIPALSALESRTYDRCDVCHRKQVPADLGYYLRHIAARPQPARPSLEMAQICAVCHSDPHTLERYDMSDAVASYMRSYHGKASLLGDRSTADCLSCHIAAGANAHLMLKKEVPDSSVNQTRIADTCRSAACHPDADVRIGAAAVHLNLPEVRGTLEFWVAAAFILLTILTFGPSMLICVLELFSQAAGTHHRHDEGMERLTRSVLEHPEGRRRLTRFTVSQRIQHWVLAVLFASLAVTGFPLKFADQNWARSVIQHLGGLDNARLIHHWGGLALVAGLFLHVLYILWSLRRKRYEARRDGEDPGFLQSVTSLPMWVGPRDAVKMLQLLGCLLRLSRRRPSFGRFNVKEKFEYIGVFWGTILLGVTGILLWGEQISSHFLPGRILNLALIAHTYEAFLAIIHVGILHIVNVVLSPAVFPLSPATITGSTPVKELAEGHEEQVLEVARDLGIVMEGGAGHG